MRPSKPIPTLRWSLLGALALAGALGGVSCAVQDQARDELIDEMDGTPDFDRDTSVEGADCSLFKNYPAPPPYVAPGPHCTKVGAPANPGCPDGLVCPVPASGWEGPYNIYKDNCHDAASCGVDAGVCANVTTGILSCTGNTSGIGGHTVNYSVFPGEGDNTGKWVICLSEPQQANPDADKCCWVQDTKTPKTGQNDPGHACYEYQCHPQDKDGGGTALPAGQCWPTPSSDPPCGTTWDKEALACCQKYAKRWDHSLPKWCSENGYNTQIQFRCEAYAECVQSAGADLPWDDEESGTESGTESGDSSGSGTGSSTGTTHSSSSDGSGAGSSTGTTHSSSSDGSGAGSTQTGGGSSSTGSGSGSTTSTGGGVGSTSIGSGSGSGI